MKFVERANVANRVRQARVRLVIKKPSAFKIVPQDFWKRVGIWEADAIVRVFLAIKSRP